MITRDRIIETVSELRTRLALWLGAEAFDAFRYGMLAGKGSADAELRIARERCRALEEERAQASAGLTKRQLDEITARHASELAGRDAQIAQLKEAARLLESRIAHQRATLQKMSAEKLDARLDERARIAGAVDAAIEGTLLFGPVGRTVDASDVARAVREVLR